MAKAGTIPAYRIGKSYRFIHAAATREFVVQALKDATFYCGHTHLDLQDEYGRSGQIIPVSMTPTRQEE
jgi:hypothetical protein